MKGACMTVKKTDTTVSAQPSTTTTLAQRIAINSAPGWMPKQGDTLIGELVGVRIGGEGGQWGKYPVLVFRRLDNDEYVALHAFHTLLRTPVVEMLKDKRLGVGGNAVVSYLGVRNEDATETSDKNKYHAYYVEPGDGSDQILDTTDPASFPF